MTAKRGRSVQPFETKKRQAGMTLIEVMIASTIAMVFTYGGYQWLGRSQKYMALKKTAQLGRTETQDLAAVIKKDWDYRLLNTKTPGVPDAGFAIQNAAGVDCAVDKECPRLKLWIKRGTIIDEVVMENICVTPDGTKDMTVPNLVKTLNFADKDVVNITCGTCSSGQVPAVRITGTDMATKLSTLKAENRIFPTNVAVNQIPDPTTRQFMRENDVLGMQVCFLQRAASMPINVDVRSIILAPGLNKLGKQYLQKIQYTQVFPYTNFANIRLEQ